jgi:hypothetical protein
VQLVVSTGYGNNPIVSFTILACGPLPYSADLVLTGDAQITAVPPIPQIKKLPSNVFAIPQSEGGFYILAGSQIMKFNIPKTSCQADTSFAIPQISGYLSEPILQSWSGPLGLWHGPHASQTLPHIGLTSSPTTEPFSIQGTTGEWTMPGSLKIEITDVVPSRWSADSSAASRSSLNTLSWSGTNEITPNAELTDTASLALLQDWIVICGIGFGICGAILASLLFEWLRPREPSDRRDIQNSGVSINGFGQPSLAERRVPARLALLCFAFIVGYVRMRQRRHKP